MPFNGGTTVRKKEDFPSAPHLAIITFGSVTYDYDPGDNACRCDYTEYTWWPTSQRDKWTKEMLELMAPNFGFPKPFIALDEGKRVEPKLNLSIST